MKQLGKLRNDLSPRETAVALRLIDCYGRLKWDGIGRVESAKRMGFANYEIMRRRIHDPRLLTIREMETIAKAMGITFEELTMDDKA